MSIYHPLSLSLSVKKKKECKAKRTTSLTLACCGTCRAPVACKIKKVRYSLGPPRSVLLPHFSIMAHFLPWLSSFRTQMKTYCILICQPNWTVPKKKEREALGEKERERVREREGGQSTCSCLLHLAYPYRSPKIPWLMKCSSKFKPRSSLISCRHCYASLSFILFLFLSLSFLLLFLLLLLLLATSVG